jgi:hypothetical protein
MQADLTDPALRRSVQRLTNVPFHEKTTPP